MAQVVIARNLTIQTGRSYVELRQAGGSDLMQIL